MAEHVESELNYKNTGKEPDSRLVSEFKALQLEKHAKKHWDMFYKRNGTRFFKDRNWSMREFTELHTMNCNGKIHLLEVGCGVGNFIFPLISANRDRYFIYACDFSDKAIALVQKNTLYNEDCIKAMHCDITKMDIFDHIALNSLDIITLIFVLSAIHPQNFTTVLNNLYQVLKPGGILLFRDYGLNDMTQLRFKAGHKISDNFYMRQDGTRSYFFSENETIKLFEKSGFHLIDTSYIYRRTINKKENVNVSRVFIQGKYKKPL